MEQAHASFVYTKLTIQINYKFLFNNHPKIKTKKALIIKR